MYVVIQPELTARMQEHKVPLLRLSLDSRELATVEIQSQVSGNARLSSYDTNGLSHCRDWTIPPLIYLQLTHLFMIEMPASS
jgi:hypothetical protein